MKIIDFLKDNKPHISCELFPPKKWENLEAAKKVVADTAALKPDYMSVTYGATGGTSKYTVDLANEIQNVCIYMIKDKIILITGGACFIGSHLCNEIIKNNTVFLFISINSHRQDLTRLTYTRSVHRLNQFQNILLPIF